MERPAGSNRPVRPEIPTTELPRERLAEVGEKGLSLTELLAIVIGTGHGNDNVLQLAQTVLSTYEHLPGLTRASLNELQQIPGIGLVKASRLKASVELGRRLMAGRPEERRQLTSPAEVANFLMPDMMHLDREHLRLVLLDTRNRVMSTPTLYVGSLNTSVVRVGELFKPAIRESAAAIIVAHNHPSGDPSPSPEDVNVTRQIVQAGQLLDIAVLDHIVIGHQRYVSLKERQLGFD